MITSRPLSSRATEEETTEILRSTTGWRPGTVECLVAALREFGPGIDDPAVHEPQTGISPVAQPGVVAFRELVLRAFPDTGSLGILRPAHVPGRSEHKEGRAWDWKVCRDTQGEQAEELLSWLLATDRHGNAFAAARRFGIMYLIWDSRIWGAYAAAQGWRPYTGPHPHTDHVHISFSRRGARGETSWWRRFGLDIIADPAAKEAL
ncbi:hypothetical protein NQK81_43700 [Amycolatopsis roodepoortensis]|uniref:hypothetical protein n=1 Tax=Amycolatopsis roodepoortensis TaxID=700274 RepID=UPI00214C284F|nr:hypothetical protein [Amycolatopsis roodepoortensis]UUV31567.1 hypothetical protein NQK81_43700 [Amycolatopsis roodepoortensis]